MPLPTKKTKAQLDAEVPEGGKRLAKLTKVVALEQGYYGVIREPGDVFHVLEGTIMEPNCWFEEVSDDTATNEEQEEIDNMSVGEIKIELARLKVDFKGVAKKDDLGALLLKARKGDDGEDLA